MEIVDGILSKHPRKEHVKIVHQTENRGVAEARNTGVRTSTGEYVFFLDSDDELALNCIETLVEVLAKNPVDLVMGEKKVFGKKGNSFSSLMLDDGIYLDKSLIFNSLLEKRWYDMPWNKLVNRKIFEESNCWFVKGLLQGEDTLWCFQMALTIQSMAVINIPTYYYHIRDNSCTQKQTARNIESFYLVLEGIIRLSIQKQVFDTYPKVFPYLESLYVYFLKSLLKNDFSSDFVRIQKQKLAALYRKEVWSKKAKSLIPSLKAAILYIALFLKYRV
jgi:glycosyltransferase involved in cell wall biosynthesis